MTRSICLFLLIVSLWACGASASRDQFKDWYPEYGFIFDRIVHTNCSSFYDIYLHHHKNRTHWYHTSRWMGSGSKEELISPLISCILDHTSEYMKTNMAGAGVVLGVTPILLATVGASVDETTALGVIWQRPILALILAAGSPAVFQMRAFENRNVNFFEEHSSGRVRSLSISPFKDQVIVILEHIIGLLAIVNIATVCHDLGYKASRSFAPQLTFLVMLWAFLSTVAHIGAAIAFTIHIRVGEGNQKPWIHWLKKSFLAWGTNRKPLEFDKELRGTHRSKLFSWLLSIATSIHLAFGTLVLSNILFISVRDSISVVGRFLASVIVCRLVLRYELARLRTALQYTSSTSGCHDGSTLELQNDLSLSEQSGK